MLRSGTPCQCANNNYHPANLANKMTQLSITDESDDQRNVDDVSNGDDETNLEDEDDEEEDEDSGNEEDEDFLSEELNLPETEDDDLESDAQHDYPVIMDDSDEDRIFKRQLSYPPVPQYHPPRVARQQPQPQPARGRVNNPRDKIGVLTPMEEVTEPPSSAATSIDGDHRRSRNHSRRAGSRNNNHLSPIAFTSSISPTPNEQRSILKSKENLQDAQNRRVTFEGGNSSNQSARSASPADSLASNTSEYSSMNESSGRRPQNHFLNQTAKNEIQDKTIAEEAEETDEAGEDNASPNPNVEENKKPSTTNEQNNSSNAPPNGKNTADLDMISDIEQGEKVIQWQMENAKSESGGESSSTLDTEFPSIVNGIIAELHNLDELLGSASTYGGEMEMNASKQDHLANVSTQLATYLAQVSPQTILTNLPQVIPLVTTLLYLTGSNFRSQLASLTAVNVFIERLRDCKAHSGLRVLPNADLTWLLRALCEISSESSRSVLRNEGVIALARLIKTAGPEMVFEPILFILMGNDEKVRRKRKDNDDEDRIVIPTGGPGGAPKIKATALDSLTFALLTFPRDDFDLELVAKLGCHCLLHPKRRMRQASLECLAVVAHALGIPMALPLFRQVIMEEEEDMKDQTARTSHGSISSDASFSGPGSASSNKETEEHNASSLPASRIPVPTRNSDKVVMPPEISNSSANQMSPIRSRSSASPISAISARISRHLLPTPSLNDLVEYAVKIPASNKLLCRQNLAISRQEDIVLSGGESGESGGSANINGRRITSSSGTSSSSVTNIEIELEPVLNNIGSGRRKQNELSGSVMAGDVAWILAGSGPIKTCDGTSILAPIYKLPEKQLISDLNMTQTHLRQLGMVHSSGMESDSNSSENIGPEFAKMRRNANKGDGSGSNSFSQSSDGNQSSGTDPNMGRYYYANPNNGMGRGMVVAAPPDNNNGGRISANGSFSLLPNKYSLAGNGMGGRPANNNMQHGGGVGSDMMVPPHQIPGTYDFTYGNNMDAMDGYGNGGFNGPEHYDQSATALRAPSRAKMAPLQPVNSLRQKYFDSSRGNKDGYSDDDGGVNDVSESSASSDEEDDIQSQIKQEALMKAERRASQVSLKSSQRGSKGKSGKTSKKHSSKKSQKEGKSPLVAVGVEPDKVEQIVNRLQQEYQVYRVDRVELDQAGLSPEELAAAKKKRGELDSAGSNSRDSGVSIGAGSVGSVHTPPGEPQSQQQPSLAPTLGVESHSLLNQLENRSTVSNNGNSVGKKEISERKSKRKSSTKSIKKSSSNSKAIHHAVDGDDVLSRNWKSTPDVASIGDDYDPRLPLSNYHRLSTDNTVGGGAGHEINLSSYHASALGDVDNFMLLHRKPVLAGRRQSLGRPMDDLDRQLSVIPAHMRSSRMEYHHPLHHHHHQNGYGGLQAGMHEPEYFQRVSSMLEMDKAPSRESSAGSGNTYSLLNHDSLHPLSPNLRSSKSTGNLLGVDDPYRPHGNPYLEIMDHPGSPGRRMLHSRLASHHALGDFGNSTDDMEFPMTPQSESSSNTLPKQSRINGRMNSKVVPKKIYKGSFREVNARNKAGSMGAINADFFPLDLKPVSSPKHALPAALLQVQASDWETNVDGFRQLVRLARHNPEFIRSDLHNVNMNALRHVMNLRTQVCRAAILFFRELFMNLGKAMEHDSERIAEKLLDKASDTNKFIREDSGKALEALVLHVSPAKALTCLDMFGTRHRNPAVRSMTARMTTKVIEKLGPDRSLTEVPERLLPMLCKFLQEGSLDTRMSAKLAFSILMDSTSFDNQLKRHVPADTLRHVQKAMKAITTKS